MEDGELLKKFEECTLLFEQWTHRAHVRVAYLYATSCPFEEAMNKTRAGIQKYNKANNRPEGPDQGYNETTTRALLHLVAAVAAAYKNTHRVSDAEGFCDMHPQLMSKHVLRFFYSPGRRMDPRAKTVFVEPDLSPLPRILPS